MADTAITISGTRVSPLAQQEEAATGFNTKFSVLYSDIAYGTGSSDTVTLTLGALPAKYALDRAALNVTTAFAGTTAMTVIVGTTTTTNALVTSQSILTAGFLNGTEGIPIANATATATKNLVATFTNATGGSPSALTAGALDIYMRIFDTTKLP